MQQLVVGLLGAMLSYVVYSLYEAFIDDDDDVIASVAGGQLVLTYFAALAVYTSDASDENQGVFSGFGFGIVLLLLFFASFIVAAVAVLVDVFGTEAIEQAYSHTLSRMFSRYHTSRVSATSLESFMSDSEYDGSARSAGPPPSSSAADPTTLSSRAAEETEGVVILAVESVMEDSSDPKSGPVDVANDIELTRLDASKDCS